jgi:hypothetical protein
MDHPNVNNTGSISTGGSGHALLLGTSNPYEHTTTFTSAPMIVYFFTWLSKHVFNVPYASGESDACSFLNA